MLQSPTLTLTLTLTHPRTPSSCCTIISDLFSPDWVQDAIGATKTWGGIGDWDVSGVKDMSWAFSKNRDVTGSVFALNGNSVNIASFIGTGMDKWITSSLTTLTSTFHGAVSMNENLANWDVSKVNTLENTFYLAQDFNSDISAWNTSAVRNMERSKRD